MSEHHDRDQLDPEEVSRRSFLAYLSGVLSLLIGVLLAVPLVGFALAPLMRPKKKRWVKLTAVSEVPHGKPTKFVYSFPTTDGWLSKVERGTVYVVTMDGTNFVILSNVCTHAGCGVRWDEETEVFRCPCHDGRFNREGKVVFGPPPDPLRQFPHTVKKSVLYVQV